MKTKEIIIRSFLFGLLILGLVAFGMIQKQSDDQILSYVVDPKSQAIDLYWKNDSGQIFKSIQNLKVYVENRKKTLLFAMNAGMYTKHNSPKGLFIQHQKTLTPLDTLSGNGNFYLKPNGVFYLTTSNIPNICNSSDFKDNGQIKFATQSGPMLVINGKIHPGFSKGSPNLNIRNGVGILPDNKIIFAMSKQEINFYDFAIYFKSMGCKNALFLDGLVSRAYLLKENWIQTGGNFGVIIGVTKSNND